MKRRYIFAAVTVISFFALPGVNLFACSCAPFSVEEAWDHSDLIITGEIVNVQHTDDQPLDESKITRRRAPVAPRQTGSVTYEIAVTYVFASDREQLPETIKVTSPADSAACGFAFEHGEEYLVYGYPGDERCSYSTNLCTRTANVSSDAAQEDLSWLRDVSR